MTRRDSPGGASTHAIAAAMRWFVAKPPEEIVVTLGLGDVLTPLHAGDWFIWPPTTSARHPYSSLWRVSWSDSDGTVVFGGRNDPA